MQFNQTLQQSCPSVPCARALQGVALRRLLNDPVLEGVTHVVVDEVHERSADSDLLLLLLRDLLRANSNSQLRIILMSATAEADAFVQYFAAALDKVCCPFSTLDRSSSAPYQQVMVFYACCQHQDVPSTVTLQGRQERSASIVSIAGFTHPVQDLYLEDILERTGFQIGRTSKCVTTQ